MSDWAELISNAALGSSLERGANARSAGEVLDDAVRGISSDDELSDFYSSAASVVTGRKPDGSAPSIDHLKTAELRLVTDAIIKLKSRGVTGANSLFQEERLEEICWGRFNSAWQAQGATPRAPFVSQDAAVLYLRAILRELGSPLRASETSGSSSIFGADPMVMLDLLERDRNISRFLALLLAYANQGWLHPADIVLRFDRWHSAFFNASTSDIAYRSALTVVGQGADLAVNREKLVLLLLSLVIRLMDDTAEAVGSVPGVFDGRPSADTLRELAAIQFGTNALSRAMSDRHREAASLAKAQESSVVRYLENLAHDAQEMSDQWRAEPRSRGEIEGLVCEVLMTRARPRPIGLQGATQAQLISFYNY